MRTSLALTFRFYAKMGTATVFRECVTGRRKCSSRVDDVTLECIDDVSPQQLLNCDTDFNKQLSMMLPSDVVCLSFGYTMSLS